MPFPTHAEVPHKVHKTLLAHFQRIGLGVDDAIRIGASELAAWPISTEPGIVQTWMCGHRASHFNDARLPVGPCDDIDVVIVGPYPEPADCASGRHFAGECSTFVFETLTNLGIDLTKVYYTTAGRHALPDVAKKYNAKWAEAGFPFAYAELKMLKPKVILAMGAYAVKTLFGTGASIDAMRGNIKEWNGIPVVPTVSPMQFLGGYAGLEEFEQDIREALVIAFGDGVGALVRDKIEERDYRLAITADEWEREVDAILAENPERLAVDCEWGNDVGREEFSYTISCQVSWKPRCATFFAFRMPGCPPENMVMDKGDIGNPTKYPACGYNVIHTPEETERCRAALTRLLKHSKARLGGHNLRVDVKTLLQNEGIDLREKLVVAFDTMLVFHILHQDQDQGLEVLIKKYAPEMGSYWEQLQGWLKANNRKQRLRYGYRDIPGEIIIPYGCCDADGDLRCWLALEQEWAPEEYAKRRKLYAETVIPANEALLEIETGGLLLDKPRMYELHEQFMARFIELRAELRGKLNWPLFNPGSTEHVTELLFSATTYKGKDKVIAKAEAALAAAMVPKKPKKVKAPEPEEEPEDEPTDDDGDEPTDVGDDDKGGGPIPAGAILLGLEPVCNNDKYPVAWDDIVAEGKEKFHKPSTKAESLKIILKSGVISPKKATDDTDRGYRELASYIVQTVHDLKILAQYLSNFLKIPKTNEFVVNTTTKAWRVAVAPERPGPGEVRVIADGNSFLERCSQVTGRVTGTILQTTDTGRCKMSKANLQVFPKKQEGEIKRIFGDKKVHKVKTAVVPRGWDRKDKVENDDDDWVTTEADFKQAENWIMAITGNDHAMLKILRAGRDLHSENCVNSFRPAMPEKWVWNGSDPEKGKAPAPGEDLSKYLHSRVVKALVDCIDPGGAIIKTPAEVLSDYELWNAVVKALFGGPRTAAKSVSFGIPYGRKAKALSRESAKAGVDVTVDDTQAIIDTYLNTYTGVRALLDAARKSALENEYVEAVSGRRRYFTGVSRLGRMRQGAAQREAGNFPIQGAVGDLLFVALVNLVALRKTMPGFPFHIRLVIHDAIVIEHRRRDTKLMHDVLRFCMGEANPIPGFAPQHLDADIETFDRWGGSTVLKS